MQRFAELEKDYYLDADDMGRGSDHEYDSDSSEDEVQKAFAEIAGWKRQPGKAVKTKDAFEAQMEKELECDFLARQAEWMGKGKPASARNEQEDKPCSSKKPTLKKRDETDPALGLDDQGTVSDEEFERDEGLKDDDGDDDDMFYDPDDDEMNQKFVDDKRKKYSKGGKNGLPHSDAVLNCPACMTLLCLDCQRHEIYQTQYRAMFVSNCIVKRDELLHKPLSRNSRSSKSKHTNILKSGERLTAEQDAALLEEIKKKIRPEDLFYPVACAICKTEVGVMDTEEIYHFFNILASHT